jgi:hypothetical protein
MPLFVVAIVFVGEAGKCITQNPSGRVHSDSLKVCLLGDAGVRLTMTHDIEEIPGAVVEAAVL